MTENWGFEGGKALHGAKKANILLYVAPDEAERRFLVEDEGIDPHDLGSALDPDELGRVEHTDYGMALILKVPRNYTAEDQLLFTVTSMGLFIYPNRLVVVTTDPLELFDDRMVHRVANVRDAVLKILYGVIAHFLGHLKVINMLSEALEKRVNASMGNRYLLDMFTLEKSLVYFVNGISSNQMVLEKMRTAASRLKLVANQREILDDIIIENLQCSKQAEIYTNILTGLMDARGSVVNNNLNLLMKRLTIISVIFMPMNVLAGMGGMSEFSTWTSGIPWWLSYGFFVLGMVFVGFATAWVLRKSGLDRDDDEDRKVRAIAAGGRRKIARGTSKAGNASRSTVA
ncbi:MAG: magnesium transporter CorA family protein [Spirochaetes bacterium]|nr:magnesium transporter CorA family protein [Spirochaetota bacterium]